MKNLFKFAFVAVALTAFTACENKEAATETEAEATETTVEETAPVTTDVDATVPADTIVVDSATVVE